MKKDYDYFKKKEKLIHKAIERVKNKLLWFKSESEKIPGYWTDENREYFKDWNLWHDLQYRLENRMWDNWSEYKDWHWDTYQFNTYNV